MLLFTLRLSEPLFSLPSSMSFHPEVLERVRLGGIGGVSIVFQGRCTFVWWTEVNVRYLPQLLSIFWFCFDF